MGGHEVQTSPGRMASARARAGSPAKMLQVLELFNEEEPVWSAAALIEALETSRATGYRYIKTLHDAGLLATLGNGYYSLGPRIIEMDMQIRLADPLLLASQGVLEALVDRVGHSAVLLTAFHDVSVLCIGECRSPLSPATRPNRGQRRSLFQGAESKVILAHLPHHRLKTIYAGHAGEIEAAGLGNTWKDFRKALGDVRKDGYLLAMSEFNPGVYGVAAPILTGQRTAVASVGLAWDEQARSDVDVQYAISIVKHAAETVSDRLVGAHKRSASGRREPPPA